MPQSPYIITPRPAPWWPEDMVIAIKKRSRTIRYITPKINSNPISNKQNKLRSSSTILCSLFHKIELDRLRSWNKFACSCSPMRSNVNRPTGKKASNSIIHMLPLYNGLIICCHNGKPICNSSFRRQFRRQCRRHKQDTLKHHLSHSNHIYLVNFTTKNMVQKIKKVCPRPWLNHPAMVQNTDPFQRSLSGRNIPSQGSSWNRTQIPRNHNFVVPFLWHLYSEKWWLKKSYISD